MPQFITADAVRERLFEVLGFSPQRAQEVAPRLTDPVIDRYIDGKTSIILKRVGLTSLPQANTTDRNALEDVCLEMVVVSIHRDYFGRDPSTMEALNKQYDRILRSLDDLSLAPGTSGSGGVFFDVVGAR